MELKPLLANVIVGRDLAHCVVLACHPDERKAPDGRKPSLTRRTIAMHFDGEVFSDAISLPFPIHRGWSSANGFGYCAPIRGSEIHVFANGEWHRERFAQEDRDVLRMWGISGADSNDDLVYVSTDEALFIRQNSAWTRHTPPEPAKNLYGVHGLSPNELYVCSDAGLLLWTGSEFTKLENRPRPAVKTVLVSGEEMYAGWDYLLHWTKTSGWRPWEPRLPDPTALLEVQDTIIVGTFKTGVMERHESAFVSVTPPFMCLQLQHIGDGAFAMGDDRSYIQIRRRWQELAMPQCAVGELPSGIR